MRKKTPGSSLSDLDEEVPDWVDETLPGRSTPYTEEELDLLVDSTLERIEDTAAWTKLVARVGKEAARRELRARLIMRDEVARKLPRH